MAGRRTQAAPSSGCKMRGTFSICQSVRAQARPMLVFPANRAGSITFSRGVRARSFSRAAKSLRSAQYLIEQSGRLHFSPLSGQSNVRSIYTSMRPSPCSTGAAICVCFTDAKWSGKGDHLSPAPQGLGRGWSEVSGSPDRLVRNDDPVSKR